MLQPSSSRPVPAVPAGRAAGVAIAASGVLALVAIAHHPTIRSAHGPADVLAQVRALSAADEAVHGVLIVLVGLLFYGFAVFSQRRGLAEGTVLGGLIAYALASAGMIGAALLDGFLIPALGARYAVPSPRDAAAAVTILAAIGAAVQVLSKFAVAATALAIALWSVGLVRAGGALRAAGFIGIASAVLPLVVLIASRHLDPHSLGVIVALQALWYVTIGALLVRGDL
jgi:hypothetical protein